MPMTLRLAMTARRLISGSDPLGTSGVPACPVAHRRRVSKSFSSLRRTVSIWVMRLRA